MGVNYSQTEYGNTLDHPIHGGLIGVVVAAFLMARNNENAILIGAAVGGGSTLYMSKYGHALPVF